MTVQDHISRLHEERKPAALLKLARWLLRDEAETDDEIVNRLILSCGGDRLRCQRGVFRWAVSDLPAARLQWEILDRAGHEDLPPTRDRYVERVWHGVAANRDASLHANLTSLGLLEPYRSALFTWLLRRFDLRAALRLFTSGRRASAVLLGLPAAVAVASAVSLIAATARMAAAPHPVAAAVTCALAGIFTILSWRLTAPSKDPASTTRPRLAVFLQALVPRLLAAVAIGYLFLAAAPELVVFLVRWSRPSYVQTATVLAILLATWLFTALHVGQRIHPRPGFREVGRRAALTVWIGVAHAALLLPFGACVLFSPRFLNPPGTIAAAWTPAPSWPSYLLVAAIALALGMALELAWEEKPLTEPL